VNRPRTDIRTAFMSFSLCSQARIRAFSSSSARWRVVLFGVWVFVLAPIQYPRHQDHRSMITSKIPTRATKAITCASSVSRSIHLATFGSCKCDGESLRREATINKNSVEVGGCQRRDVTQRHSSPHLNNRRARKDIRLDVAHNRLLPAWRRGSC
jgi:hypothetical protein